MFKLNSRIRPGAGASPLKTFFGRHVRADLPNACTKECKIMETLEARIRMQFNIAKRRGHWSRDQFKEGDKVCIKDAQER